MRKPGKQYRYRQVSPLERILQGILVLGLLFFIYQAVQLWFPGRNEPASLPTAALPVSTLKPGIGQQETATLADNLYSSLTSTSPSRTSSATPTADGVYLLPAKNYIPDLSSELSNYLLESEGAMDMTPMRGNAYQAHFTNSYPLYHDSDDAFSVLYNLFVFADTGTAEDYYAGFTMDSLVSIYESTYKQRIYPTPIDRVVENIDALRMFCFDFTGTLKPEIHCEVLLIDNNLVGQVTIKIFNTGSSETKAISQAKFFTDILVENLK